MVVSDGESQCILFQSNTKHHVRTNHVAPHFVPSPNATNMARGGIPIPPQEGLRLPAWLATARTCKLSHVLCTCKSQINDSEYHPNLYPEPYHLQSTMDGLYHKCRAAQALSHIHHHVIVFIIITHIRAAHLSCRQSFLYNTRPLPCRYIHRQGPREYGHIVIEADRDIVAHNANAEDMNATEPSLDARCVDVLHNPGGTSIEQSVVAQLHEFAPDATSVCAWCSFGNSARRERPVQDAKGAQFQQLCQDC